MSVDRYRSEGFGVGLVKGFSFVKGALAASISHDAHNIISAVTAVKDSGGGMAVVPFSYGDPSSQNHAARPF